MPEAFSLQDAVTLQSLRYQETVEVKPAKSEQVAGAEENNDQTDSDNHYKQKPLLLQKGSDFIQHGFHNFIAYASQYCNNPADFIISYITESYVSVVSIPD